MKEEILKNVKEMVKKADNYDQLKKEYTDLIDAIKDSIGNLSRLTGSIPKPRGSYTATHPVMAHFVLKLKTISGFQLKTKDVDRYLEEKGIEAGKNFGYRILNKISKMDGMEKVRDQEGIRVFYHPKH